MSFDFKNNLSGLMKEAQNMQKKLQEAQDQLSKLTVTGEAGAGMVKVTMNGKHQVLKISIDPTIEKEGLEVICDLIAGACNNAADKIKDTSDSFIQKLTAGIQLPDDD